MKFTSKQIEAILWAMFGVENEIQHLEYLLMSNDHIENEIYLRNQLSTRKEHYKALHELIIEKEEK